MKWYKKLYIGDSLIEKRDKVIRKVQQNVLQPGVFIIVLATNGKDNFRILSSLELLQRNYPKDDLTIVGIAKGKEEAFELVGRMVQDVLNATGSVKEVWKYFDARGGL